MSALTPPGRNANRSSISFSPCRPRNARLNTCAQIRMNSTIAVMRVVVRITSRSTSSDKRRANATTRIEPSAPIDAASVGAATPPMIEPSTDEHQRQRRQRHLEHTQPQFGARHRVALGLRHRRHRVRAHHAVDHDVDAVQRGQHQPGHHRRREQRAHRQLHDVRQQDQHQARRDDLAQRARGADRAAGDRRVVAAPQQRGQRQQPERDHGGADDAGGGAHQHAHADDAQRHAAAQAAGQVADHVEQVFGQARLLQHHAHEHEQRDRQPLVVGHHAVDARRQQVEQRLAEADEAEHEAARRQRDAHRHAGHQQREEADQQADREPLVWRHRAAVWVSRRAAAALCASACSANSAKPSGISALSTQRCVRPPGSDEISLIAYACCT